MGLHTGDASKAECLYALLMKFGCMPEDAACASMISLYGKQQKLKQAQDVFAAVADSSKARKLLHGSMIDAFARCGKSEEAYQFFREETVKGHDLGAVAISMLVNVLTNCGKNGASTVGIYMSNLSIRKCISYHNFKVIDSHKKFLPVMCSSTVLMSTG